MTKEAYDAVIIGAGQSGGPLARALAEAGRRTALIERRYVGGTCINTGCTPSKTMIASARVAHQARRSTDFGVHTGPVSVNLREVQKRKQGIIERFRTRLRDSYEQTENLDLLMGEGGFSGPGEAKTILVQLNDGTEKLIDADLVVINTGGRATIPAIMGIDSIETYSEVSIMDIDTLPEHLVILGGGAVGLEQAQMFRRFGSRVTIIERDSQLLTQEDEDVASAVADILRNEDIDVMLNASLQEVQHGEDGGIQFSVKCEDDVRSFSGSHLLVAVGRTPNTEALHLDHAGIQTDEHGFICVDTQLQTNIPGIYATGDVNGGPGFTHISYDDFRILRENLLNAGRASTRGRLVPYTIFTDPQLGRVGMSEREAQRQNRHYATACLPMSSVSRGVEVGETQGFMKAIVDTDTRQILGCAILAEQGGEIMAVLEMAMMGNVPYTAIRDGIFAHPTYSEALNNLFSTLEA